jgi:hypothetical protein
VTCEVVALVTTGGCAGGTEEKAIPLARYLLRHGVIDLDRDAVASASGHDLRGLVDRLGAILHAGPAGNAAASAVDVRTRFAERGGDTAPRSARRAGDDGSPSFEWFHLVLLPDLGTRPEQGDQPR